MTNTPTSPCEELARAIAPFAAWLRNAGREDDASSDSDDFTLGIDGPALHFFQLRKLIRASQAVISEGAE